MKKFVLSCVETVDGSIKMSMTNTGFNGMELIAILETKKADLIEQCTHPEKFKHEREYVDSDGSIIVKLFKEDK